MARSVAAAMPYDAPYNPAAPIDLPQSENFMPCKVAAPGVVILTSWPSRTLRRSGVPRKSAVRMFRPR